MTDLEIDIDIQKRTSAIINYYRLVYIGKLTEDKSTDTFRMLGGQEVLNRFVDDVRNNYLSYYKTNNDVLSEFEKCLTECTNGKMSLSETLKTEIKHLDWMKEVNNFIEGEEDVYQTVVKNTYAGDKQINRILLSERIEGICQLGKKRNK